MRTTLVISMLLLVCLTLGEGHLQETPAECPKGWTEYKGNCYITTNSSGNIDFAQGFCQALGGYVVDIQSAEEQEFVQGFMKAAGYPTNRPRGVNCSNDALTWLGLIDRAHDGNFTWVPSGSLTYTNWATAEPNNFDGKEYCVEMRNGGKWNDDDCHCITFFACKTKARCSCPCN